MTKEEVKMSKFSRSVFSHPLAYTILILSIITYLISKGWIWALVAMISGLWIVFRDAEKEAGYTR